MLLVWSLCWQEKCERTFEACNCTVSSDSSNNPI
jgi:hypothetical protein